MDKKKQKKILSTVVVVLVAVLAYSTALDKALNFIPVTNSLRLDCLKYLDNWTAKSITTFALAKTINAALSVVENSQVAATVLGTGVTIAVGEVVRPLNNMIDRVSTVALASATSLGIQRILLEIGSWVGLKLFLTISMMCLLIDLWAGPYIRFNFGHLFKLFLVLALMVKFLIPVTVLTTGYVGDRFMEAVYTEAQQKLEQLQIEAKKDSLLDGPGIGQKESHFIDRVKNAVQGIKERINTFGTRWATMSGTYSRVAVNYIVVFIAQTMLMPLLVLWGLIKLVGTVFSPGAIAGVEQKVWNLRAKRFYSGF